MKHSWNYKLDGKNFLFSLFPLVFIVMMYDKEDNLFTLWMAAIFGINTLIQAIKSKQRDVLSIVNRKMYKKNLLGKKKEYDLQKYNEISIDYLNKKKSVMVGFYLDENRNVHKDILLQNEYQVSLDVIKQTIDEIFFRTEYVEEEEDFFFYQEKETFLKEDSDSLLQESYRKTIKVANIVLVACYLFIVVLTLVFLENTVEGILAMLLLTYILIMISVSRSIMQKDISVPVKRKYNLMLYIPGIILMMVLAVMIFDN